jgi:hypothetical protein
LGEERETITENIMADNSFNINKGINQNFEETRETQGRIYKKNEIYMHLHDGES